MYYEKTASTSKFGEQNNHVFKNGSILFIGEREKQSEQDGGGERERERGKKNVLPSAHSLLKCWQLVGLGWVKAGSLNSIPAHCGSLGGWQGPIYSDHHHCLPCSALAGSWNQSLELEIKPRYFHVEHSYPNQCRNACPKLIFEFHFFHNFLKYPCTLRTTDLLIRKAKLASNLRKLPYFFLVVFQGLFFWLFFSFFLYLFVLNISKLLDKKQNLNWCLY